MSETLLVLEEPGQPGRLTHTMTLEELLALCDANRRRVFIVHTELSTGQISLREFGLVGTTFTPLTASQAPTFSKPERPRETDYPAMVKYEQDDQEVPGDQGDAKARHGDEATLAPKEQPSAVRAKRARRSREDAKASPPPAKEKPSKKGKVESAPHILTSGAGMTFGEVIPGDPKDLSTRVFGPDAFK